MNRLDETDDLLDRAARAMTEAPPEGDFPEQEILRNVQSLLNSNGHGPKLAPRLAPSDSATFPPSRTPAFFRKFLNVNPAVRVAASLLVAAATLAAITWALFQSRPVLAFSIVAQQFHDARTMSAELTVQESSIAMTGKLLFSAPGHFRIEFPGIPPEIADLDAGRVVLIDHAAKSAIVMKLDRKDVSPADDPTAQSLDFIEKLRNISHSAGQSVGEDQINGIRAKEFIVTEDGQQCTIWADAKTGAPIRVESTVKIGDRSLKFTLDRVLLDQPLEESLFSTAVPQGYSQQQTTISSAAPTEKDLATFFKEYAARTGVFPPSLDDFTKTLAPLSPSAAAPAIPNQPFSSADSMQIMLQAARAMMLLNQLPPTADWHYAGKMVDPKSPDAATKPLFWYHAKGTSGWHVLYADLHASDLPTAALSADLPAERQPKN